MFDLLGPYLAAGGLLLWSAVLGVWPTRKWIEVREAKHELKQGSAGFLRSLSGWTVMAFWLMATWFCATIIGDWWMTRDLEGAFARSWVRLQVLLEIAAALVDD